MNIRPLVFLVSCVLCIDVALPLRAAYSKGKVVLCTPSTGDGEANSTSNERELAS